MKTLLVLITMVVLFAASTVVLSAQGGGDTIADNWAVITAIASVIFSFGTNWQTIRVHGKVLKEFEEWRKQKVDPTLEEHGLRITVLEAQRSQLTSHKPGHRAPGW